MSVAITEPTKKLTLPRSVIAAASPRPYLLAHLDPQDANLSPIRPNGRAANEFRAPSCHTGSLNHCNGSAVVRVGDTAVVCGVHAEILLASSIPDPPSQTHIQTDQELMTRLQLLVPNVELATGCSPAHLPGTGGPPSIEAQTLTQKLLALLYSANVVQLEDLRIKQDDELDPTKSPISEAEDTSQNTVAYWALYASVFVLSLSGSTSLFDVCWAALVAALADVKMPHAMWDIDAQNVICSPDLQMSKKLNLSSFPMICTWAVFTGPGAEKPEEAPQEGDATNDLVRGKAISIDGGTLAWLIADPDTLEDSLCRERITIAVDCSKKKRGPEILLIEKDGGDFIKTTDLRSLHLAAANRWAAWRAVIPGS